VRHRSDDDRDNARSPIDIDGECAQDVHEAADRITGHSGPLSFALMLASSMAAVANSRVNVAAVSAKRCGSTIVGFNGQTMRTTVGLRVHSMAGTRGRTSCTESSSAPLRVARGR
jgi:hypothetical protein